MISSRCESSSRYITDRHHPRQLRPIHSMFCSRLQQHTSTRKSTAACSASSPCGLCRWHSSRFLSPALNIVVDFTRSFPCFQSAVFASVGICSSRFQGRPVVALACHCDDSATLKLCTKSGTHDINPLGIQISVSANEISLNAFVPSGVFQFKQVPLPDRKNGASCSILARCTLVDEHATEQGYTARYGHSRLASIPFRLLGKMAKRRRWMDR
eukprot:m.389832 g.389832  ORF g.389832 m.389832 type:complete len:213 (-) comp56336_c0_seq11:104-742(-)